jgi:hypothetical protein
VYTMIANRIFTILFSSFICNEIIRINSYTYIFPFLPHSLLLLYFAFVRCKLEYASVARNPAVLRSLAVVRIRAISVKWSLAAELRT